MQIEDIRPTICRIKCSLRKVERILYYFHDHRAMGKERDFLAPKMQKKMKKKREELVKAQLDIQKEVQMIFEEIDEEVNWLNDHIID